MTRERKWRDRSFIAVSGQLSALSYKARLLPFLALASLDYPLSKMRSAI
ncbi:MAG: hypothetical protein F6J93_35745 [Oscillatoria sp. SIO1A7]|nr:hypothetical protein [Oscillatoria sp. SIO1A7]